MKIAFASIAISALTIALTACQATPSTNLQGALTQAVQGQDDVQKTLAAYNWAYQSTQENVKPIQLSISDNRISVNAGCNTMNTMYEVKQNKIITKALMSTMMACDDATMRNESFAGKFFDSREIAFQLDQTQLQQPVLTLQAEDGKLYTFIGTPTPETKYQGQAEIIFLEIKPEFKACTSVIPQQCLQVREIKYDEKGLKTDIGDWQLLYDPIEGYEHNTNTRTLLRVKRFDIPNVAADQSGYAYVHDLTVEYELLKP